MLHLSNTLEDITHVTNEMNKSLKGPTSVGPSDKEISYAYVIFGIQFICGYKN